MRTEIDMRAPRPEIDPRINSSFFPKLNELQAGRGPKTMALKGFVDKLGEDPHVQQIFLRDLFTAISSDKTPDTEVSEPSRDVALETLVDRNSIGTVIGVPSPIEPIVTRNKELVLQLYIEAVRQRATNGKEPDLELSDILIKVGKALQPLFDEDDWRTTRDAWIIPKNESPTPEPTTDLTHEVVIYTANAGDAASDPNSAKIHLLGLRPGALITASNSESAHPKIKWRRSKPKPKAKPKSRKAGGNVKLDTQVLAFVEEGLKIAEIAERLGTNKSRVSYGIARLTKAGKMERRVGGAGTSETAERNNRIMELTNGGYKIREILKELENDYPGIKYTVVKTVRSRLHKAGKLTT